MTLLLTLACVDPTLYAESPVLETHVDDWRDEVIYQLMVDRFANGDVNNDYNASLNPDVMARYMGGDYQGVIDNVDYLVDLGITSVWISPAVVNVEEDAGVASYHGYWTQDFMGVNPHFGDLAKMREMVDVLHDNGILVILDIVANHVGQLFFYDINRNGQADTTQYGSGREDDALSMIMEWDPAYDERGIQAWTSLGESGPAPLGWVYMPEINRMPPNPGAFYSDNAYNRRGRVTDWGVRHQVEKGDFPGGLKDLDTLNPDVQQALIDSFTWWIVETDIDGFRIDTLKHVENDFWQEFAPAIRQNALANGKEKFLMFGEAFDGSDALIGSYTCDTRSEKLGWYPDESSDGEIVGCDHPDNAGGEPYEGVDSVFNFSQKFQVFDDVFKYGAATSNIEALYAERDNHFGQVPKTNGAGQAPRDILVNFIDNHDIPRFLYDNPSPAALKSAIFYLLTEDGIPCVYYGTEQAFEGGNDPANREPLWWSGYDQNGDLFLHTKSLIALRKAYEPLRRGDFQVRWASERVDNEEDAGIFAFERATEDASVLVVVNTHDDQTSETRFDVYPMATSFPQGTTLVEVWPEGSDRTFTVGSGGEVTIDVGPRGGSVLVPEADVISY
ncbi:MAG: alpha-amylase [Proteobacteria bacterium]|nr:alpha-amylase [Pseudomonadota bacterium]MCP4921757.1 alpha-amylase [Pseudomonadota bacterium]